MIHVKKSLLVVAAFLALAAPAGAADRVLRNPGRVLAISTTATDVVYAYARRQPACPQLVLWRTSTRATIHFPSSATGCPETSTGSGIAGIATAGGRALWLSYIGGNIREWSLYTASVAKRTPKQLRFVARDVELAAPIVVGRADELNLPYAVDNQVVDLSPNGSRRWAWTAPGPVASLAAGDGRVAVQLRDGTTYVLSPSGRPSAPLALAPGTIRYAAAGLAHQDDTKIVLGSKSWDVTRDGHLLDFLRNEVVYVSRDGVHGIRTTDSKDVLWRRLTVGYASFHRGGLAYTSGDNVYWVPWSVLVRVIGD